MQALSLAFICQLVFANRVFASFENSGFISTLDSCYLVRNDKLRRKGNDYFALAVHVIDCKLYGVMLFLFNLNSLSFLVICCLFLAQLFHNYSLEVTNDINLERYLE